VVDAGTTSKKGRNDKKEFKKELEREIIKERGKNLAFLIPGRTLKMQG